MIIYTAIFNNYDRLAEPIDTNDNIRYVCFTDCIRRTKKSKWEIIQKPSKLGGTLDNRYYKINCHKFFDDEVVIYLDGNYIIYKDFYNKIGEWLSDADVAIQKHPFRKSIYEEAKYLINNKPHKIYSKNTITKQMNRFSIEGYPKDYQLNDGSFFIRKNNEKMKKFNEYWWNIVSKESRRDQLSFMYTVWKNNTKVNWIDREELKLYTTKYTWHK